MTDLEKAIIFATKKHAGQLDKADKPYILHPLAVMMKLGTEQEQIVAVLHDVMEDCGVTAEELSNEGFSRCIIEAVEAISRRKDKGETYREYIQRCEKNTLAVMVKFADLEHNMSPERAKALPEDERRGLEKRYMKALYYLKFGGWPK